LNSCIGSGKVSSNSESFASKTTGRQKSGMLFSPHEPGNVPERFVALIPKVCTRASLGGSATHAVAKQLDDPGQPGGPTCEWGCKRGKPLGENPPIALIVPTSPAGQPRLNIHPPPLSGKITQRPYIGAMTGTRLYATDRTGGTVPILFGVTTIDRDDPVRISRLDGGDG